MIFWHFPFPYDEGIFVTCYAETDIQSLVAARTHLEPVTVMTAADLDAVPRIRGMLDVCLGRDLLLPDGDFVLLDSGLNSYFVSQSLEAKGMEVMIGLPHDEAKRYAEWHRATLQGHVMEYKGRYFSLGYWIE